MTIAIHQPNYLPWLGFFSKIHHCDLFVFHDAVPFSGSGYTKRCKVLAEKNSSDVRWLTVPVCKFSEGTPILEIVIDESTDWRKKHRNALTNAYASAAHYTEIMSFVKRSFEETRSITSLSQLNREMILKICDLLDVKLKSELSSELPFREKGTAFNLKIVKHFSGGRYLNGTGAANYENARDFNLADIEIKTIDAKSWLRAHPYTQMTDEFVHGLSILDVLMFEGVEKTKRIIVDQNIVVN